jgi:hypothetical protein
VRPQVTHEYGNKADHRVPSWSASPTRSAGRNGWTPTREATVHAGEQVPAKELHPEDIDQQIWGPYRLKPGRGAADEFGRASIPVRLSVGEEWSCHIQKTDPPQWAHEDSWNQQYRGKPIRLELRCVRDGFKPWTLRREIERPDARPPLRPPRRPT